MPSVGADGTLIHVWGTATRTLRMVREGRDGDVIEDLAEPADFWPFPALSADGTMLAVSERENEERDLYIHDLVRGTRGRLTFGSANSGEPFWAPDGATLYYHHGQATPPFEMYRKRIDGSGEPEPLGQGWRPVLSPDGRYLLFTESNAQSDDYDIWIQDLEEGGDPSLLVTGPNVQANPRVSPDGRFFAYNSLESGNIWGDIYLKRFPGGEGKWQVSVDGGNWPRWSREGDRIYYSKGGVIYEVSFSASPAVRLGQPTVAFPSLGDIIPLPNGWDPGYEVFPGNEEAVRFASGQSGQAPTNIVVVESWAREFEAGD